MMKKRKASLKFPLPISSGMFKTLLQPRAPTTPEPGCNPEVNGSIADIRAVLSEVEGKLTVVRTRP
jgi:hypothetical protein